MRTLGLLGGTTWLSTLEYYRLINQQVNHILGKNHSAKIILNSIDFQEAVENKRNKDEVAQEKLLRDAASSLKNAGVQGLLLCANTLHKYADAIHQHTTLPIIHIAEETAKEIRSQGIRSVALLGTLPTMEEPFYKEHLKRNGISTIIPGKEDREWIDEIIFSELALEQFKDETKSKLLSIIHALKNEGAEGAILGCTELPLIITDSDIDFPLFNTLLIHSKAASLFITETN